MQKVKRLLLYLASFMLLSLLSGYITFKVLNYGRMMEVPDLVGRRLDEAEKIAGASGLSLNITSEEHSLQVPHGHIISQDMPPGSPIKDITGIGVRLSKGSAQYRIPSVTGKSLEEAVKIFKEKGIEIEGIITVHSDKAVQNTVIAQRPLPEGKTAEPLMLIVSSGSYDVIYYCPSFEGLQKEEAIALTRELGIEVELHGKGEVVSEQRPEPGALINTGSFVHLRLEGRE